MISLDLRFGNTISWLLNAHSSVHYSIPTWFWPDRIIQCAWTGIPRSTQDRMRYFVVWHLLSKTSVGAGKKWRMIAYCSFVILITHAVRMRLSKKARNAIYSLFSLMHIALVYVFPCWRYFWWVRSFLSAFPEDKQHLGILLLILIIVQFVMLLRNILKKNINPSP